MRHKECAWLRLRLYRRAEFSERLAERFAKLGGSIQAVQESVAMDCREKAWQPVTRDERSRMPLLANDRRKVAAWS